MLGKFQLLQPNSCQDGPLRGLQFFTETARFPFPTGFLSPSPGVTFPPLHSSLSIPFQSPDPTPPHSSHFFCVCWFSGFRIQFYLSPEKLLNALALANSLLNLQLLTAEYVWDVHARNLDHHFPFLSRSPPTFLIQVWAGNSSDLDGFLKPLLS